MDKGVKGSLEIHFEPFSGSNSKGYGRVEDSRLAVSFIKLTVDFTMVSSRLTEGDLRLAMGGPQLAVNPL